MYSKTPLFATVICLFVAGGIFPHQEQAPPPGAQPPAGILTPTPEQLEERMKLAVKQMVDQALPLADADEDGELSFEEFKELFRIMTAGRPEPPEIQAKSDEEKAQFIQEEFDKFDADADDSITKDEMRTFMLAEMQNGMRGGQPPEGAKVEGDQAPEFTLQNIDGEEVALSEVLEENEVVLIDFWASWCGPCIAKFPKLEELHAAYKDKGFEIVFVSLDDNYEDWKQGLEDNKVPGIHVADLEGIRAPTAKDYGVYRLPAEFLVDSEGEILDRDVFVGDLKGMLTEHFDVEEQKEVGDL